MVILLKVAMAHMRPRQGPRPFEALIIMYPPPACTTTQRPSTCRYRGSALRSLAPAPQFACLATELPVNLLSCSLCGWLRKQHTTATSVVLIAVRLFGCFEHFAIVELLHGASRGPSL